jgi:hypothetical protein
MNNVATYGAGVFAHLDRLPPQLMLIGYWKMTQLSTRVQIWVWHNLLVDSKFQ